MTTYYTCVVCNKAISENDLAAANPSIPLITCCDCIGRTCCVTGCNKKYMSKYDCIKMKILFEPCCVAHTYETHQCRHSINCKCKIAGEVFCNIHRCTVLLQDKTYCHAERIPGKDICPVHAFQFANSVKKEHKEKKGEQQKLYTHRTRERLCDIIGPSDPTESTKSLRIERPIRSDTRSYDATESHRKMSQFEKEHRSFSNSNGSLDRMASEPSHFSEYPRKSKSPKKDDVFDFAPQP